jgi:hypothetical protein
MLQAPILLAAGAFTAVPGPGGWSQGATVLVNGPGDKTIRLDQEADAAECAVICTLRGPTSGTYRVVQTSDKDKRVLTFAVDGVTPADLAVDFLVLRKMGG